MYCRTGILCSDFQIYTAMHACFQPELNTVILPFEEVHIKAQSWCTGRSSQNFSTLNNPSCLPGKQLSRKLMEQNSFRSLLNQLCLTCT